MNWIILESPALKGSRSRKGRKRQRSAKYGQVVHGTVRGKGRIARLREDYERTRTELHISA